MISSVSSSSSSAPTTTTTTTVTTSSTPTTSPTPSNLPQYIAPNPNAAIPSTSDIVHLKFNYLSYVRMVEDYMLTAQFVQALPPLFSKALDISVNDVIVVTITSASSSSSSGQGRKRDQVNTQQQKDISDTGVLVAIAVPNQSVTPLAQLVQNRSSSLYDSSNGQIATLIDSQYPVSSSDSQGMNDPNGTQSSSNSGNTNGGGSNTAGQSSSDSSLSRGAIIGIAVSVGVVVYAAATMGAVTMYRRHRRHQQEQEEQRRRNAIQEISAPIILDHSFRGSLVHRDQFYHARSS
ncbi:uncharacterized protein BX664DRAFT_313163 [Halteromyces radiatus]|uniref:uncharacterized protein n=1 Tax=Halteromyces radiatus TaxID=101107 RepID=UPI0022202173|nr:uncharacterized protein BX664DRAFT_313163 [Halteromyces radiatus]KAI8093073.1 hypothetical protein BX664DRAFT_313163 [Halteromyces radiatus]